MGGAFRILGLVGVVFELLAGHAIPALLAALHDVAVGLHTRKKLFHDPLVAWIGGADQAVVADLPAVPELAVLGAHAIAVGLGAEAGRLRGALDLLAVLVAAGDEHHPLPLQPLKPRQRITSQRRVGAAQMRLVVDVVEGGGEGVSHRADPTELGLACIRESAERWAGGFTAWRSAPHRRGPENLHPSCRGVPGGSALSRD